VGPAIEKKVLRALEEQLSGADALLVSDYGSGLITPGVLRTINLLAKKRPRLVTVVDSRYQLTKYRNIWAAVPNETEAAPAAGYEEYRESNLPRIGEKLLATLKSRMVLVTRGSKGMSLFQKGRKLSSVEPYGSTRIVDVNGAGDTVAAAFTLGLAAGAKPEEAMALANAAGGVAVMKTGPASVTARQLMANLRRYL
jgi:rfaE bifunctional protein kinase chain/domain